MSVKSQLQVQVRHCAVCIYSILSTPPPWPQNQQRITVEQLTEILSREDMQFHAKYSR